MPGKVRTPGKALAAVAALEGQASGVKALVGHQLGVAAETPAAFGTLIGQAAAWHQGGSGSHGVGTGIGVRPLVPVEVGADIEALAAVSTPEGALARVRPPVLAVVRAAAEHLPAVLALVALLQNHDGRALPCQDLATTHLLHNPPAQTLTVPRNHAGIQLHHLRTALMLHIFFITHLLLLAA